jgi:ABC-2 type transport system permease protein
MDRLNKFFALVKNEYIKIYKKRSSRILLVIFLAVCLCFAPLMKLINNSGMKEYAAVSTGKTEADYLINSMNTTKREIENSPDMPLREEKQALVEAVDPNSPWQGRAYHKGITSESKREMQTMTMLCKTDDWRGFCKYLAENSESSGEKWAYRYKLEHEIGYGEEFDEKNTLLFKIGDALDGNAYGSHSSEEVVAIGMYKLEHEIYDDTSEKDVPILDMNHYEPFDFWDVMMKIPYVESFIGIIMLMIAGGIVASEFSQGTVKFLLISPVQRSKILAAKYFTVISLGFLLMLTMFLINIPMVGLLFGFKGISLPYLSLVDGEIVAQSSFIFLIKNFMLKSVQVMISTTLAFMISSLMRSTALAIVAGFIVNTIGSTIIAIMVTFKMDWGRYLIFANTDLLTIYNGESMFPQHNLGFAVVVVIDHMAVFLLTAWDGFTRRSV